MDTRKLKDELFRLYDEYLESYLIASDIAYDIKLRGLKAGEVAPKKSGLYFDDNRQRFNEKAEDLKAKALKIINKALDEIVKFKTAAPSTDAVNYLTLLKSKTKITEEELNNALTTYGENYAVCKAFFDLAEERKIYGIVYNLDVDKIEEVLKNILASVNKWGSVAAENGLSQGSNDFEKMWIEQDIPDVTF